MTECGIVDSLWRYPVKSLIGEKITCTEIDSRGVSGDRLYAISNVDGKFGSGKNTRRFRRVDGLSDLSAESSANGVRIKFADGAVLADDDPSINDKLSRSLGERVTLTKEGDISHFDDGEIHLFTTQSLSLLHDLLPNSGIDLKRFRPNMVIDSDYLDQQLIGKILTMGRVTLQVTHKTERCRMITMAQAGLENRPEILKTVSQRFDLNFGVYAKVLSGGVVSVGDKVKVFID